MRNVGIFKRTDCIPSIHCFFNLIFRKCSRDNVIPGKYYFALIAEPVLFSRADLLFKDLALAFIRFNLSAFMKSLIAFLSSSVRGLGSTTKSTSKGSLINPMSIIFKIFINKFQAGFPGNDHSVSSKMNGAQRMNIMVNKLCFRHK